MKSQLLIGAAILAACRPAAPDGEALVIRHATVIDGTARAPQRDVDVCVEKGRITAVARGCKAARGATEIDATGQFLLPGFVDMHVHLLEHGRDVRGNIPARIDWDLVRRSLRLLLDNGVTTVRDPGSETEAAVTLRDMLQRGAVPGPRLLTAGRIINASPFNPEPFRPVNRIEDIQAEIQWQKAAGVDFIKVYSTMPPDFTRAAIEEAHRLGLPVIGHLQRTTWTDAARMGVDFIAHGAPWTEDLLPEAKRSLYPQNLFGRVYWLEAIDLSSPQVDTLVRELVAHHVVIDPTLIASHTKFFGNDPRWLENPDNKRLPEDLITGWRSGSFTRDWTAGQYAEAQRAWPKMLGFTKLLYDRGVRLVVGTDAPTAWVIPGSSFHDELALMRDAGIPTDALIRMATHDAARALGREKEFGSVQVGRRADLVLLTANPLERIENTRAIKGVIQGGRIVRSN